MMRDRRSMPLQYAVGWRALQSKSQRLGQWLRATGPAMAAYWATFFLIGALIWIMIQIKQDLVGEAGGYVDPLEVLQ